jgi:hypothetical protein
VSTSSRTLSSSSLGTAKRPCSFASRHNTPHVFHPTASLFTPSFTQSRLFSTWYAISREHMVTLTGVGHMGMGNLPPGREKGFGFLKPRLGDTIQKARRTGTTGFRALLVFLLSLFSLQDGVLVLCFFHCAWCASALAPVFSCRISICSANSSFRVGGNKQRGTCIYCRCRIFMNGVLLLCYKSLPHLL